MTYASLLIGAAVAFSLRSLTRTLLLVKLRSDVRRLNEGDRRPLLDGHANDAVFVFDDGFHRWAGTPMGSPPSTGSLSREFVRAGLRDEVKDLWLDGPPWAHHRDSLR